MNKEELLKQMKGRDSINNWDVMCAYNENNINKLLEEKYKKGNLVSDVNFELKYHDELFDDDVSIKVDLKLKEPKLEFITQERHICKLTMPIEEGTYIISTKEGKKNITDLTKADLQVTAIVPMVAIMGSLEQDNKNIINGTDIIYFKGDDVETAHITLHFQNIQGVIFDIEKTHKQDEKTDQILQPNVKPLIIEQLKLFFHDNVSEIDYVLGGITNENKEEQFTLEPKNFIFSASKLNKDKAGSLNIYIQTTNSENQGDEETSFQPSGKSILPIPDEYTASLIISKEILINTYLKEQFNNLKWIMTEKESNSSENCINLELKKVEKIKINGINKDKALDIEKLDDIIIDLEKCPVNIKLDSDNMTVSWTFSQEVSWKIKLGFGMSKVYRSGKINVNISYEKKFSLKVSDNQGVCFNCKMNKEDFKVTTTRLDKDLFGLGNDFEKYIQDQVNPDMHSFEFNIKDIGIFVVANLLFPEKQVFNIDSIDGFHVPHDLILFGNLEDSL